MTGGAEPLKMVFSCCRSRSGRHFSLGDRPNERGAAEQQDRRRQKIGGALAVTSSLLPTYARAQSRLRAGRGRLAHCDERRHDISISALASPSSPLGHSHPHLVKALTEQGEKLWHVSNLFRDSAGRELGARLAEASFADLRLLHQFRHRGGRRRDQDRAAHISSSAAIPEHYRIITFQGAFHGRTMATVAAGGNPKYLEGFGPPLEGFDQVPFGDLAAVKAAIAPANRQPSLLEPMQGEGGIRVATPELLEPCARSATRTACC